MKNMMLLFLCLNTLQFGCNDEGLCLSGSGTLQTYEIPVSTIENVSLMGPINLRIVQSDRESVKITCEPEAFHELVYHANNKLLNIGFEKNIQCLGNIQEVWVNLQVKELKNIYVMGDSQIENTGTLFLNRLSVDIEGNAKVSLAGKVVDQIIYVNGSSIINNASLLSKNTHITVMGSADIQVACSEQMDIIVDGRAEVDYKGSPEIYREVKGSLQLNRLHD